MESVRREIGIRCLSCGKFHLPPTHDTLDNWTCNYCHSGLVSTAMLVNLIPRDLASQVSHPKETSTKTRPCPKCHATMCLAPVVDGENRVELDLCLVCHLVWFDSGEMVKLLRLRPLDKFQHADLPAVGVRAKAKVVDTTPDVPLTVPWATVSIFAACTTYRIFFDDAFGITLMPAFLATGLFVERFAGAVKIAQIFFLALLVSRIVYSLGGGSKMPFVYTANHGVVAVLAFALIGMNFKEFTNPKETWRKSQKTKYWLIAIASTILVSLAWDFFRNGIRRAGMGLEGIVFEETALHAWLVSFRSPGALAYFAAITIGAMFKKVLK